MDAHTCPFSHSPEPARAEFTSLGREISPQAEQAAQIILGRCHESIADSLDHISNTDLLFGAQCMTTRESADRAFINFLLETAALTYYA